MRKIFLYISLLFFLSINAQQKLELKLHFANEESLPKKVKIKSSFQNIEKLNNGLIFLVQNLNSKGYIEASIDSFILKEGFVDAYVYLGRQYAFSKLENGNLSEEALKKIRFKEQDYQNKNFSFNLLEETQNKVLAYYQNRGYAFAETYLDSFAIDQQNVYSKIYAKPHGIFIIDTIIVEGKTKTTSRYLQNYLGIKKGDLYNQSKIEKISQKLAQLKFIKQTRKSQMIFVDGKVSLYVFIEKQKSNEFDVLIGVLPNDKLTDRKITITGEGKLHLHNSFGVGEEIYVHFKQLRPQTQNVDLELNYPFFLNLPVGINGVFDLYKNDTSFLNLKTKAGVVYPFNGSDYLQLFYQNQISNVLSYDTTQIRNTQDLPDVLDKSSNHFGLKMHFQKLDYIFSPRNGYDITFSGSVGLKKIKQNASLTSIQENIYDQIKLSSTNFNFATELKYYIPILRKHSILLANSSHFFVSKDVLENEKFRIGGAKSLRGFDEEEIFSPYFSIFTLEYHFSLSKNAYFYTFGDLAIVEDVRFGSKSVDTPFGFGVGATFETKGGIFSLSYALGKQLDNKIELKNGKIHFGYINLF
jgi:outer membrane protein assembly factor BamA